MKWIDYVLNRITMYRLVLYYLIALVGAAAVFGYFGVLPYSPLAVAFSTALIVGVCFVTQQLFSRVFEAAASVESVYITALILVLIISPIEPSNLAGMPFLIWASIWAIASKFIFTIGKKHVFNPAAFAVALTAFTIAQSATWWVAGNLALLPIVIVGGLLVVRKLQRFDLVLAFAASALASTYFTSASGLTSLSRTVLHTSFFFLAFVMLTEPATTPPSRLMRIFYGALVGILFAPSIHIGPIYSTPELALLVGNIFSFLAAPKGRFVLKLAGRVTLAKDVYEFIFTPDRPLMFTPGQYVEWTLPHFKPDTRGTRRYFTLASSPTEKEVRLGAKFYPESSSFKHALGALQIGDTVAVGQLAGEFTLPRDVKRKLVFIAGGIGVTPFRSMMQYLIDTKEKRDVVLLYSAKSEAEFAYKDIFDRAANELGVKTIYSVGALTEDVITKEVPDLAERTFYISGPRVMVDAFVKTLQKLGVKRWKIKTDFFPGLV